MPRRRSVFVFGGWNTFSPFSSGGFAADRSRSPTICTGLEGMGTEWGEDAEDAEGCWGSFCQGDWFAMVSTRVATVWKRILQSSFVTWVSAQCNLLAVEYPGYGLCSKARGCQQAAALVVRWVYQVANLGSTVLGFVRFYLLETTGSFQVFISSATFRLDSWKTCQRIHGFTLFRGVDGYWINIIFFADFFVISSSGKLVLLLWVGANFLLVVKFCGSQTKGVVTLSTFLPRWVSREWLMWRYMLCQEPRDCLSLARL